jgi:hypothetical protein
MKIFQIPKYFILLAPSHYFCRKDEKCENGRTDDMATWFIFHIIFLFFFFLPTGMMSYQTFKKFPLLGGATQRLTVLLGITHWINFGGHFYITRN